MQTFSSEFLIKLDISRLGAPIFESFLSLFIMLFSVLYSPIASQISHGEGMTEYRQQIGLPQKHKGVLLESLRQTPAVPLFRVDHCPPGRRWQAFFTKDIPASSIKGDTGTGTMIHDSSSSQSMRFFDRIPSKLVSRPGSRDRIIFL